MKSKLLIKKIKLISISSHKLVKLSTKTRNYYISCVAINKIDKFKIQARKILNKLNINSLIDETRKKRASLIFYNYKLYKLYIYDNRKC